MVIYQNCILVGINECVCTEVTRCIKKKKAQTTSTFIHCYMFYLLIYVKKRITPEGLCKKKTRMEILSVQASVSTDIIMF